ncbi:MAG: bifunctional oligoribonuclease/PAP phosphatase NrnA [Lachnospiraceae bacterium]|nr:bifunctional oligoribonuclease/PAP phosphatase NrnA [Lachnospiraceae bacterium]
MSDLKQLISQAEHIMVAGHIRPDGDCVGSCVAVYHYIRSRFPGKRVDVYLENLPGRYECLDPAHDIIRQEIRQEPYDLFLVVDSSSPDRLGEAEQAFYQAEHTLCVDHHVSNLRYAEVNIVVSDSSSTCEVLYELMQEEIPEPEIATALYVGIISDSGVFRYSNTSARTMEIAGRLMQSGIPFWDLIDRCVSERSYVQTKLLGQALSDSRLFLDGQCIVTVITRSMMEQLGAKTEDVEGVVEQLRVTRGVEVAVLLHEIGNHQYKVSMRSNDQIDVSRIAVAHGGGGHQKAAGFQENGTVEEIMESLCRQFLEERMD